MTQLYQVLIPLSQIIIGGTAESTHLSEKCQRTLQHTLCRFIPPRHTYCAWPRNSASQMNILANLPSDPVHLWISDTVVYHTLLGVVLKHSTLIDTGVSCHERVDPVCENWFLKSRMSLGAVGCRITVAPILIVGLVVVVVVVQWRYQKEKRGERLNSKESYTNGRLCYCGNWLYLNSDTRCCDGIRSCWQNQQRKYV